MEAPSVNEILRRALISAHLDEADVAARLEVDPKTVRRWLEGRLPYTRHRWALADLLNVSETDLWPDLHPRPSRPDELLAVYPHRSSIPRDTWRTMFASAERGINILDYSSLFLAKDAEIVRILAEKARSGVDVQIALRDPDSPHIVECGLQETIGDTSSVEIRAALNLYRPLFQVGGIEIRLHRAVLYTSIYRADNDVLCNQHTYGVPAAHSPVLHLHRKGEGDMVEVYLRSFFEIWSKAE